MFENFRENAEMKNPKQVKFSADSNHLINDRIANGFFKTIFLISILLLAKAVSAQQYIFKNYSVEDGVAQSQVYTMLQDSRGYIWIGTRGGGITRFDGQHFTTFTTKDGLCNNYIWKIKEDVHHNLWIATNHGLSMYNGLRFNNYFPEQNENAIPIHDFVFDGKHAMIVASQNGLYSFDHQTFKSIEDNLHLPKESFYTICKVKDSWWCGNGNGLTILSKKNSAWNIEKGRSEYGFDNIPINIIKTDDKNTVWLGTNGAGVYRFMNHSFLPFQTETALNTQNILDIYFDKNQTIWFATLSNGVCAANTLSNNNSWLTENEGLSNNHVRSILQDNSGNFWFGTSGGGVCNYFGKQFIHFDTQSGLGGNFIYSIYKDSRNKLWLGTSDKGVTLLDSNKFNIINTDKGFANVKVKAIIEDNYGNIYLGTDGNGVYLFSDTTFTSLESFHNLFVRAFDKDKDGNIWMATAGNGLYKITPSEKEPKNLIIEHYTNAQGLLQDRLTCLHIDKKGMIWFGTESNGVGIMNPTTHVFKKLTIEEGLPSNSIRCMDEDMKGNLWIGTAGDGIAAYSIYTSSYKKINEDYNTRLKSNNIYLICHDMSDNMFVGSETGLDFLELNSNRSIIKTKHYSKGEGFLGIETCQNSVLPEQDGTIWFGTIHGLSKYNPGSNTVNVHEPITTITNVRLFYNELDTTKFKHVLCDWHRMESLTLPYNKNHLTFDFMAINLSNPDAVQFQWKLDGFDEQWSPVSKQRSVTYSNIPPGDYTFLVKACNEDGVWNTQPSRVQFTINSPFWKKWWFIVLSASTLLLGFFVFYKIRVRSIQQKAKGKQQQLEMKIVLSELEQKALRLQMNPHFLFNALNSIQSLIGTDNEQQARYYLAKFSSLMRQILDNSRSHTISLQEEIDSLENYLLIEKFCNGNRFDYKIETENNLETDYIKIPPMLLQPFVENCIKHGLRYLLERKGFIHVLFREKENILECVVTDNGIGRQKAAEMNKQSKEGYHTSTALIVIHERLNLLNKDASTNAIEIIDLHDEHQTATGTQVIIRLPIF